MIPYFVLVASTHQSQGGPRYPQKGVILWTCPAGLERRHARAQAEGMRHRVSSGGYGMVSGLGVRFSL